MRLIFEKRDVAQAVTNPDAKPDYDVILSYKDKAGGAELKLGSIERTVVETPVGDIEAWGWIPAGKAGLGMWDSSVFQAQTLRQVKSELSRRMFYALTNPGEDSVRIVGSGATSAS